LRNKVLKNVEKSAGAKLRRRFFIASRLICNQGVNPPDKVEPRKLGGQSFSSSNTASLNIAKFLTKNKNVVKIALVIT
jgi:hypothetical protein